MTSSDSIIGWVSCGQASLCCPDCRGMAQRRQFPAIRCSSLQLRVICVRSAHSLQEHGIGQDFAMYYIAYAAFSELRGNFSRAESIYQQGIER